MSCYEWEHGTITLPSAAVAPLKKALREEANRLHDEVLAECKAWWQKNKTTSWATFDKRLEESSYGIREVHIGGQGRARAPAGQVPLRHEESLHALDSLAWRRKRGSKPPRGIQVEDLKFSAPRYTNRDQAFILDEATITFVDRQVTWDVPENNHARDHAREHRLAKVFFRELERIRWTRGTGGAIVGNDEYSRDSRDEGGGGNYVTEEYGPNIRRPSGGHAWTTPTFPR